MSNQAGQTGDKPRPTGALFRITVSTLGFLIAFVGISWAAELPLFLGVVFYTEQFLCTILALALALIFLTVRATRSGSRGSVPWYDAAAALVGFGAALYLAIRYPVLAQQFFYRPTETFTISIILLPLVFEALRRTSGWALPIVLLLFIAYGLFGQFVPGTLRGLSMPFTNLVSFLCVDNVAMLSLPMKIICTVVILFVFLGQLLLQSGGSTWFTDLAAATMGWSRGGAAKIAVVASGLFGTMSGAAVANVASVGVITIPLMRNAGYSREAAGGIESVASTGGQIMPPIMGAASFLMAEFLQVPYSQVVRAAVIPAVLYYIALFIQTDLEAAKNGIVSLPEDKIPPLARVIREGWFFTVPFIVLIYALFMLNVTAETAALYGAGSIIFVSNIIGYRGKRIRLRILLNALIQTGKSCADIIVIGAMAGMVIGLVNNTGLGFGLTFLLVRIGAGDLFVLLLLTGAICILLGMGMPTTAIYFLLATLVAPTLIKLGVVPMAAHMFVFYLGLMSMITPPVAIAAFTAANLAGAKPMKTAITAVRLGWTAYVIPFVFVYAPNLIMQGNAVNIVRAFITAIIGVWMASAGLMGFLFGPLSVWSRIGMCLGGLALVIPGTAFRNAPAVELAGFIIVVLIVGREVLGKRKQKAA